jgi:hypothetical protein
MIGNPFAEASLIWGEPVLQEAGRNCLFGREKVPGLRTQLTCELHRRFDAILLNDDADCAHLPMITGHHDCEHGCSRLEIGKSRWGEGDNRR